MKKSTVELVVVGGSAGSLPVILGLLDALPADFTPALLVVVHRPRNIDSELADLLAGHCGGKLREPDDKDPLAPGWVYLAPQNYHVLLDNGHISLDYSEPVHYCRPAIDVTLLSAAAAYGPRLLAILLSGANADGAEGLAQVLAQGGQALVQAPDDSEFATMPQAAIDRSPAVTVLPILSIYQYIQTLNRTH